TRNRSPRTRAHQMRSPDKAEGRIRDPPGRQGIAGTPDALRLSGLRACCWCRCFDRWWLLNEEAPAMPGLFRSPLSLRSKARKLERPVGHEAGIGQGIGVRARARTRCVARIRPKAASGTLQVSGHRGDPGCASLIRATSLAPLA